ncbi:putative kinase [Amycolatopsis bartoniae]|uniref:Nucleoside kinase n=1 Tax=Amycolatopsis bartoniae TaxID=941986 RepID=A0A8H9MEI6_9PSEU|nr:AAA family ATPase [Amycolatopsis bartoniae]MBB2933601.1 putative kinase [Amycolatopsis bartoniae]TVT10778.1 AAA family ATPase [Amycolatopsis bartoniae]GHF72982.1 nucleoside kinase [Amycolatopsis bartoniae]
MLDPRICPACGDRAQVPLVEGATRRCARCGHRWPFRRLPLFALTGPSGAGKSTVGPALVERLGGRAVVLEQDVLWTAGLRDDVDGHPEFRATWLRLAAMIAQSGRPVVLCGTVVPPEFEPLPERALFSHIHYMALVAEPEVLARRLRARPAWREWGEPRIAETLEFNEWLRKNADTFTPSVEVFDTTHASVEESVHHATTWFMRLSTVDSGESATRSE